MIIHVRVLPTKYGSAIYDVIVDKITYITLKSGTESEINIHDNPRKLWFKDVRRGNVSDKLKLNKIDFKSKKNIVFECKPPIILGFGYAKASIIYEPIQHAKVLKVRCKHCNGITTINGDRDVCEFCGCMVLLDDE